MNTVLTGNMSKWGLYRNLKKLSKLFKKRINIFELKFSVQPQWDILPVKTVFIIYTAE